MSSIRSLIDDPEVFAFHVNKAFEAEDKDNSGYIDVSELGNSLRALQKQIGFPEYTDEEVKDKFDKLDTSKDGKIQKEEFAAFVKEVFEFVISKEESNK